MSDYIKKEDVILLLNKGIETADKYNFDTDVMKRYRAEVIKAELKINIVEVVRCKDCEYWDKDENILGGICDEWSDFEDSIISYTKPDDYCSCGERKDGEEE